MDLLEIDRLRWRLAMACEAFIALAEDALDLPECAWLDAAIHHGFTEKLSRADHRVQQLMHVFVAAREAIQNSN